MNKTINVHNYSEELREYEITFKREPFSFSY